MNRLKQIHRQFSRMEEQRQKLMTLIRGLPEEMYRRQPAPGSWSAAQVANHLYLSENLSLGYVRKKLSYPDKVPPYRISSWLSLYMLRLRRWIPVKFKAPKAINMWEGQSILPAEELDEEWTALRHHMIAFIEKNDPAFGSHLAYRHPVAGRMTMLQMLIFFNDHLTLHLRQANRIIKQMT